VNDRLCCRSKANGLYRSLASNRMASGRHQCKMADLYLQRLSTSYRLLEFGLPRVTVCNGRLQAGFEPDADDRDRFTWPRNKAGYRADDCIAAAKAFWQAGESLS
jgi:hypothetical protein